MNDIQAEVYILLSECVSIDVSHLNLSIDWDFIFKSEESMITQYTHVVNMTIILIIAFNKLQTDVIILRNA